ncbi:MAG: DUF4476 domain-containing protein [Bacteroidota bacterium]|nr:DUF4476 domain-containing protein [Bacteroidota bacterium]
MKKYLIIMLFLMAGKFVTAQTCNVIFFTEEGERFYLVIDGIQFNEEARTNVKASEITATNHKVKILFEDNSLKAINRNLFFEKPDMEFTYVIKKNKKGAYKIRYRSEVHITKQNLTQTTVNTYGHRQGQQVVHTQTKVQHTQVAPDNKQTNSENINIGINVQEGANNVNFNFNVNSTNTQTSQTSVNSHQEVLIENTPPPPPPPIPGYYGPYGCPYPMSPSAFQSAKNSIRLKSFEDSKMTLAKQITRTNCLSVVQVKEIMMLFDFEDNRLDFAKFAYKYTCDIGNYFMVNDAFTFESTIEELDEYIQLQ